MEVYMGYERSRETGEPLRGGPPITNLLPSMGVYTKIGGRLGELNSSLLDSREAGVLSELRRLAALLGVPEHVAEEAGRLARLAVKRVWPRSASTVYVAGGALALAMRAAGYHDAYDRVAEVTGLPRRAVARAASRIYWAAGCRVAPALRGSVARAASEATSRLGLPPVVGELAMRLYDACASRGSRTARVTAAALVYVASRLVGRPVSIAAAARALNCYEEAVRRAVRALKIEVEYRLPGLSGTYTTERLPLPPVPPGAKTRVVVSGCRVIVEPASRACGARP